MEKWKDIPGWEDFYQVSNIGRVRSLDRRIKVLNPWGKLALRRYKGRVLCAGIAPNGYAVLRLTTPKKIKCVYIHDLVLAAFKGPKPKGLEVRHWNGKRTDNRLRNLKYGTRSQNSLDRHRHGTFNVARGVDHPHAKFSKEDIRWIRNNWAAPARAMARKFGVSHSRITAILRYESYG